MPAAFSSPDRATRFSVLTLTAVVFAIVVAVVTWLLRAGLREQILRREGDLLVGVTSMQLAAEADNRPDLGVVERLPGEFFFAALRTSRLRGVLGVRVLDRNRDFAGALPFEWSDSVPSDALWGRMMRGEALARLHPRGSPATIGMTSLLLWQPTDDPTVPLVEVWAPLQLPERTGVEGAAQFWMDGRSVAAEFAALDRRLVAQALLAWAAGTLVTLGALTWAFGRLADANRELRARSEDLQRANRELILAAKTSALGTVTAHLLHALKNPIAGLEIFVASRADPGAGEDRGEELAAATELTKRLRTMVNDVVGVLRDEHAGMEFELTADEVVELALAKARPIAKDRGVKLVADVRTVAPLTARRGHLAALVLQNLLQNAVEASATDASVTVSGESNGDAALEFTVADHGAGLPGSVRARLFEPCTSTKPGGSGLGLALSGQLARQAGGRLELVRSDSRGTCFRLVLDSVA